MIRYGVLYPDGRYSGDITDSARHATSYAKLHRGKVYEVGSAEDPARRGQPRLAPWYPDETEDFHAVDVNDRHQDRSGSRTIGGIQRIEGKRLMLRRPIGRT